LDKAKAIAARREREDNGEEDDVFGLEDDDDDDVLESSETSSRKKKRSPSKDMVDRLERFGAGYVPHFLASSQCSLCRLAARKRKAEASTNVVASQRDDRMRLVFRRFNRLLSPEDAGV